MVSYVSMNRVGKVNGRAAAALNLSAINLVGMAFVVALVLQSALMPPVSYRPTVLLPCLASTVIMLGLGPYLFVPPVCGWWLTVILYAAHLVFIAALVRRMRVWRGHRRFAGRMRVAAVVAVAVVSAMGIGFELPRAGHCEIRSGKVAGEPVRLAVVSDLHSCEYGKGQVPLVEAIRGENPDAVLFVGDIFDDRMPDGPAKALVAELSKRHPCIYVSGNHEYWSERVDEMKSWLRSVGVTVLEGESRTMTIKGTDIDFCGVDDPTYIYDEWDMQLKRADAQSDKSRFRILLSHRPERVDSYERYAYDLILTGHAHGGQWLIPFVGRGCYSPNQHVFPKYVTGRYDLACGSPMLVCRGLARENVPLPRYFNSPEFLLVELRRRDSPQ